MPKKIGKKERKSQNRLPEPRTFLLQVKGLKLRSFILDHLPIKLIKNI